jgi:anti-sigma regulatory factor (Ser/Thr protein kinase)
LKKSNLVLKLDLFSDPKTLCVVRATVSEMAITVGLSAPDARLVVLAVDEALTNIIRHAYHGIFDRPIEMFFFRGEVKDGKSLRDALEIRIRDQGVPVEPGKWRGRELDELRPGGLGLHFIRETMDLVAFRQIRGRNYLRLVKFLQPANADGVQEER